MLKQLIEKANTQAIELLDKKKRLAKIERELRTREKRLEEVNARLERVGFVSEVLSEAEKTRGEADYLSSLQREASAKIEDSQADLADILDKILEECRVGRVTRDGIIDIEEDVLDDIAIKREEDEIINRLMDAREAYSLALSCYDDFGAQAAEASKDMYLQSALSAFYSAQGDVKDFYKRFEQTPIKDRGAMRDEEAVRAKRLADSKAALDAIMAQYGITKVFHDAREAESALLVCAEKLKKAEEAANVLPLVAPTAKRQRGGGIVSAALLARADDADEFVDNYTDVAEELPSGNKQAETDFDDEMKIVAEYVPQKTGNIYKEAESSAMHELIVELRDATREARIAREQANLDVYNEKLLKAKRAALMQVKKEEAELRRRAAIRAYRKKPKNVLRQRSKTFSILP